MSSLFHRIHDWIFKGEKYVSKENFFNGGTVPKSEPIYHTTTTDDTERTQIAVEEDK